MIFAFAQRAAELALPAPWHDGCFGFVPKLHLEPRALDRTVQHLPVNIPRKLGAFELTCKWARRIAIAIVGFTVLAVGVAMIVLPGPAFVVIPAGLGILALEFAWAKRWLHEAKTRGSGMWQSLRGKK